MKQSIAYPQDATMVKQHECSEKTCANCFENRGCMYAEYPMTAIQNMVESRRAQQPPEENNLPVLRRA